MTRNTALYILKKAGLEAYNIRELVGLLSGQLPPDVRQAIITLRGGR